MRQLLSVITQLPDSRTAKSAGELYQCSILLPLNSPLREEIFGQVMPSKKLAKRAAALKMCIKLHELKELDDLHLLPIRQNKFEDVDTSIEEEDEAATIGLQTASNRGGFYDRCLPKCLTSNRPSAGQPVFIYALEFKLTKQSDSLSNEYFPFAVDTKLAILSSCNIPAICSFPLVTKAGEFQVDLVGVDCVILEKHQLEQLEKFHRFIFQDVIFLFKKNLEFDPESSKLKYLIAPLGKLSEEYHIDFHFVDRMVNHKPIDWDQPPHAANSYFQFDPAVYADAVVIPSYRPFGTLNTYYVDIVTDLIHSLSRLIHSPRYSTTYFRKKYKWNIREEFPSSEVVVVPALKNFDFVLKLIFVFLLYP
jgi:endoribonuclease Dicer